MTSTAIKHFSVTPSQVNGKLESQAIHFHLYIGSVVLNKSSGEPLEGLSASRVTFTFDDSSLAFKPFTAIQRSNVSEEEVTAQKERFHFLPDELGSVYSQLRRKCSMYVLFRRCSHGPLKESGQTREGAAVNYIEWRAMSSVMEHCGSPRYGTGGTLCALWHKLICLNILCHNYSCSGRKQGFKCSWKIGPTQSQSLFSYDLNQNIHQTLYSVLKCNIHLSHTYKGVHCHCIRYNFKSIKCHLKTNSASFLIELSTFNITFILNNKTKQATIW